MTSILKVDRIESRTPDGTITFGSQIDPDGFSSNYRPGEIIEVVSSQCDGSTVVATSGSYTFTDVNNTVYPSGRSLSDSYQTLAESSITYTPPAGTTRVIYEFDFSWSNTNTTNPHNILHTRFQIDGTDVVFAQKTMSSNNHNHMSVIWRRVIPITGTDNMDNGTVATWTTAKTLSLRMRNYGSTNANRLYASQYWDGAGSSWANNFCQPSLSITALA